MDGKMVGAALEPDALALASHGKDGKPTSGGKLYATSKLCNILNAYELHRRLRRSGSSIAAIAFDPGVTTGTDFLRAMPWPVRWIGNAGFTLRVFRRIGVTIGDLSFSGAALGRIAADPAFAEGSGKYFQSTDGHLIEARSSRLSYDEERAAALWLGMKQLARLTPEEESPLLR
jgi:NAD(P)-dependent dehydrogenase (short-subunit alcohol dehydrogenase family)